MTRNIGIFMLSLFFALGQTCIGASSVKIVKMSGEVKVRRGLNEAWNPARPGLLLEEIDTILILEGQAELEIDEGVIFRLASNSILDIGDLRRITKREMFLLLMSAKIDNLNPRTEKTQLRVGNVSVVHGESKAESIEISKNQDSQLWMQEFNGAMALYEHEYYTNTIVKLNKILRKHSDINDCGKIHYNLGVTFEKLNEPGQALDAYQLVLERGQDCVGAENSARIDNARDAIERLK